MSKKLTEVLQNLKKTKAQTEIELEDSGKALPDLKRFRYQDKEYVFIKGRWVAFE